MGSRKDHVWFPFHLGLPSPMEISVEKRTLTPAGRGVRQHGTLGSQTIERSPCGCSSVLVGGGAASRCGGRLRGTQHGTLKCGIGGHSSPSISDLTARALFARGSRQFNVSNKVY
jgi:hypothetical protein